MKILVVNADCLSINSSANLCHLAYIRGLVNAGHDVSVLSAEGKLYKTDPTMKLPDEIKKYSYSGMSLYQKISRYKSILKSHGKDVSITASNNTNTQSSKKSEDKINILKEKIRGSYGPHGIYSTFVKKAEKFKSNENYDIVLSISYPPASHLLAYNLIKTKRINCKHWIQIWEDPWYADAYANEKNEEVFEEEKKLLKYAEKVCYVSPLTLHNQQKFFPEYADKMYWRPLPFYYEDDEEVKTFTSNSYGYFGDYVPLVRDLKPFYKAADKAKVEVNICGNPSNILESTDKIHVYPRLTLDKLKPIEDKTNVLIFLCNKAGGQIPGKIYQYSATNKSIIFILDGTDEEKKVIKEYFAKYHRYVFCDNNVESIYEAIRKIECNNLGDVKNVPVSDFDPTKIINSILEEVGL